MRCRWLSPLFFFPPHICQTGGVEGGSILSLLTAFRVLEALRGTCRFAYQELVVASNTPRQQRPQLHTFLSLKEVVGWASTLIISRKSRLTNMMALGDSVDMGGILFCFCDIPRS